MTIDAAYSIQQEKQVGSIEVEKNANLTVLEQSPYEVDKLALKDITVWGTMLEGRVQPVSKPRNQVSVNESTDDEELIEIRRRNARDLASLANASQSRTAARGPECRCGLSQAFAMQIAR